MEGEESTLHLKAECTWRWWIPDVTIGTSAIHRCLLSYAFCVVSTYNLVLETTTLSLWTFLLYVIDLDSLGFNTFVLYIQPSSLSSYTVYLKVVLVTLLGEIVMRAHTHIFIFCNLDMFHFFYSTLNWRSKLLSKTALCFPFENMKLFYLLRNKIPVHFFPSLYNCELKFINILYKIKK